MLVPELQTEEGVELHYGLNFLGHFLLTGLLLETLARSGTPGRSARVVNMASATHYGGRLDLDNLNSRSGGGHTHTHTHACTQTHTHTHAGGAKQTHKHACPSDIHAHKSRRARADTHRLARTNRF